MFVVNEHAHSQIYCLYFSIMKVYNDAMKLLVHRLQILIAKKDVKKDVMKDVKKDVKKDV